MLEIPTGDDFEAAGVRLLQVIRDVEFEQKSGKVSDEDFAELEDHYTRKAAETLTALELLRREEERERARS